MYNKGQLAFLKSNGYSVKYNSIIDSEGNYVQGVEMGENGTISSVSSQDEFNTLSTEHSNLEKQGFVQDKKSMYSYDSQKKVFKQELNQLDKNNLKDQTENPYYAEANANLQNKKQLDAITPRQHTELKRIDAEEKGPVDEFLVKEVIKEEEMSKSPDKSADTVGEVEVMARINSVNGNPALSAGQKEKTIRDMFATPEGLNFRKANPTKYENIRRLTDDFKKPFDLESSEAKLLYSKSENELKENFIPRTKENTKELLHAYKVGNMEYVDEAIKRDPAFVRYVATSNANEFKAITNNHLRDDKPVPTENPGDSKLSGDKPFEAPKTENESMASDRVKNYLRENPIDYESLQHKPADEIYKEFADAQEENKHLLDNSQEGAMSRKRTFEKMSENKAAAKVNAGKAWDDNNYPEAYLQAAKLGRFSILEAGGFFTTLGEEALGYVTGNQGEDTKKYEENEALITKTKGLYIKESGIKDIGNTKLEELKVLQNSYDYGSTDWNTVNAAIEVMEGQIEYLNDYEEGSRFSTPFSTTGEAMDFVSLGFTKLQRDYAYFGPVFSKIEKGEKLTEAEQAVADANNYRNTVAGAGLEQKASYDISDGIAHAISFIGQISMSGGVSKFVEGVAEKGFKTAASKTSILGSGFSLGTRTFSKGVGMGAQAIFMPMTYDRAFEMSYTPHQMEEVTEEDGSKRYVMGKELVTLYKDMAKVFTVETDNKIAQLDPQEDKAEIAELTKFKGDLVDMANQYQMPMGAGEAFFSGWTETVKELAIEVGLSRGLAWGKGKILTKGGKGFVSKSGTFSADIAKPTKFATKISKTSNAFNNLGLVKATKNARGIVNNFAGEKAIGGFGEEFLEELVIQFLPTYGLKGYNFDEYTDQLKELGNADFLTNVGGTVLGLQLLMGVGGKAKTSTVDYFSKDHKANRALFKKLSESKLTDAEYNKVLNTVGFGKGDISEIDTAIRGKRADAEKFTGEKSQKLNEEANEMEANKFYNMAMSSIKAGQSDGYVTALKASLKNKNLNSNTRANINETLSHISTIESTYPEIATLEKSDDIMNVIARKRYAEKSNEKLVKNIAELNVNPKVQKELTRLKKEVFGEEIDTSDLSQEQTIDKILEYTNDKGTTVKAAQYLMQSKQLHNNKGTLSNADELLENMTSKEYQKRKVLEAEFKTDIVKKASKKYGNRPSLDQVVEIANEVGNNKFYKRNFDAKKIEDLKNNFAFDYRNRTFKNNITDALAQKRATLIKGEEPAHIQEVQSVNELLNKNPNINMEEAPIETVSVKDLFGSEEVEDLMLSSTPEHITQLGNLLETINTRYKARTGADMTFPEMIDHLLLNGAIDQNAIKNDFKIIGEAYESYSDEKSNWKAEYTKRYESEEMATDDLLAFIKETGTKNAVKAEKANDGKVNEADEQAAIKKTKEKNKKVINKEAQKVIGMTPDGEPIYEEESGKTTEAHEGTELVSTVKYSPIQTNTKITYLKGGRVRVEYIKDPVPQMRTNGFIDYKALAHPDKNNLGDNLTIEEISEEDFESVQVSVLDENGFPKKTETGEPVTITFSDWILANIPKGMTLEDFKNQQTYLDKVPMYYVDASGAKVGFLPDNDNINLMTVKDPMDESKGNVVAFNSTKPSDEHVEAVNKVREDTNSIRTGVRDGSISTMEIVKSSSIPFQEIAESESKNPITEMFPNSQVAFVDNKGKILDSSGVEVDVNNITNQETFTKQDWVEGKDGIKKKEGLFKNKVLFLVPVGKNEKGEEQYTAIIGDSVDDKGEGGVADKEKETLSWLLALNDHIQGTTNETPNKLKLSEAKFANLIKQVLAITKGKVDLSSVSDQTKVIKAIGRAATGTNNSTNDLRTFKNVLYNILPGKISSNFSFTADFVPFSIKEVDGELVVTEEGATYDDYLKSRYSTNIMGYNVGTEASPSHTMFPHKVVQVRPVSEKKTYRSEIKKVIKKKETKTGVVKATKVGESSTEVTDAIKDGEAVLEKLNVVLTDGTRSSTNSTNTQTGVVKHTTNTFSNLLKASAGLRGLSTPNVFDLRSFIGALLSKKGTTRAEIKHDYTATIRAAHSEITSKILQYQNILDKHPNTKLQTIVDALLLEVDTADSALEHFDALYKQAEVDAIKNSFLNEELDELKEKDYSKGAGENLIYDKVGTEIKRIFARVTNGETGTLGLKSRDPFKTMFDNVLNILSNSLSNTTNFSDAVDILEGYTEGYPWMAGVIEELKKSPVEVQNKFMYTVYKHGIKAKFIGFSRNANGVEAGIWASNSNEAKRKIKTRWTQNFSRSKIVIDNEINNDYLKSLLKTYNANVANWLEGKHTDSARKWLAEFGITVTDKTWEGIVKGDLYTKGSGGINKTAFVDLFGGDQGKLFSNLIKYVSDNKDKKGLDFTKNKKVHPFSEMGSILDNLSSLELLYNPSLTSTTRYIAGKSVSEIEPTTYFYEQVRKLKNSAKGEQEYLQELKELAFSEDSYILDLLLTNPDFANIFEDNVIDIMSLKEIGTKDNEFSGIDEVSSLDYMFATRVGFQDMDQVKFEAKVDGFVMRTGVLSTPTSSDKGRMMLLRTAVFDLFKNAKSYFIKDGKGYKLDGKVRSLLFKNLVSPEAKRIIDFRAKGGASNIKGYNSGAVRFNLTPALNTVKDTDGITAITYLNSGEATMKGLEERFGKGMMDILEESVMTEATGNVKRYVDTGVLDTTTNQVHESDYLKQVGGVSNLDKALFAELDYIINYKINNVNQMQLVAGDPALYFKAKGDPLSEDANLQTEMSKATSINIGKRMASMIAPGAILADSEDNKYIQFFLEDVEEMAEGMDSIIKLFYGAKSLTTGVKELIKENDIKALQEMFPKVADYFAIESTDAQEYTTVKEHLYVLEKQGRLTTLELKRINETLEAGGELKYEDLKLVMQPIKPVHTGGVIDATQGVNRMLYIKSSSFPLLPQLTADNPKLEKLRKFMNATEAANPGKNVRGSYQTANKVGANVNTIDLNNLPLAKDVHAMKDSMKPYLVLDRKNFKIQQDVPFKSNKAVMDKVSLGTQIFKLLFGDGILESDAIFDVNGTPGTAADLHKDFIDTYSELIDIERSEFLTELGITEDFQIANKMHTAEKIQKLLEKEAITRGFSKQDIKALELVTNEKGEVTTRLPVWFSANSNKFEAMLNAIIVNKIFNQKLPGNSYVVGSPNGFEVRNTTDNILEYSLTPEEKELISQSVGTSEIPDCI